MGVFQTVNELLQQVFRAILPPDSPFSAVLISNAFIVMTVILVLFIIFVLLLAFFMDFITDAWKIPFAVGVDMLKYVALFNPWMGVVGAIAGFLIFAFLSDWEYVKWFFALLSVIGCLFVSFFAASLVVILVAIVPFNTVMMILSTVLD